MPRLQCAKPQEWNSGAAIIVVSRALQRDPVQQRGDRVHRLGLRAAGALRRAGRAGGEDRRLARLLRRAQVRRCRRPRRGPRALVAGLLVGLVPGDVALELDVGLAQQVGELLVVDERGGVLALEHVGQLRLGERRVEEQGVGAELRARHDGLDEAAVVAAHDRDAVARPDPGLAPGVGERVRALVDLPEGERARLVDDRRRRRDSARRTRCSRRRASAPSGPARPPCAGGGRAARADDPGFVSVARVWDFVLTVVAICRERHGAHPLTVAAAAAPLGRRRSR